MTKEGYEQLVFAARIKALEFVNTPSQIGGDKSADQLVREATIVETFLLNGIEKPSAGGIVRATVGPN